MSANTVTITLTAKDGVSQTFTAVAKSGQSMGDALKKAAADANRGMDDLDRGTMRIGRSFRDLDVDWRRLGASAGILISGLSLAGKSFRDQERGLDTLRKGYGDAADDLIKFSEALQDNTNFSNDSAVAAINRSRSLAESYDFTAAQIETLITRTADLAAAQGTTLDYAIQATTAAMRGEAEMAEQLGLTLNDRALGIDRMAASTTDAEKAQIRLNAFLDQSAYSMGTAAEQASGLYGELSSLKNELNDAAQGFAAANPMMAEMGAFAADNAVQIGVMTIAVGQLGSSLAMLSKGGLGLIGLLTGPVGIAAGIAAVGLALEHTGSRAEMAFELSGADLEKYRADIEALRITIGELALGSDDSLFALGAQSGIMVGRLEADMARISELANNINFSDEGTDPAQLRAWNDEIAALLDTYNLFDQAVSPGYSPLETIAGNINSILNASGAGAGHAQEILAGLMKDVDSGAISWPQFATGVEMTADNLGTFNLLAGDATSATDAATGATRDYIGALYAQNSAQNPVNEALRDQAAYAKNLADAQADLETEFGAAQQQMTQYTTALDDVFRGIVSNTNAIADQAQGVADWATGIAVATEHFDEWGNSLGWWSVADDLVADATISQQDYNAAVQANSDIQAANASIQRDILSIQTQLAPIVATATEALAAQIGVIEDGDTDAQLFALGMMDAATSSQALALAQGYLANQDVFGPMIQQAAELNPMLAQILEEMGLISYNPVTNEVKLIGAEESLTTLETLNDAIERLAYTNILIAVDFDHDEAKKEFEDAFGYGYGEDPIPLTVPVDPNFLIPDGALPTFDIETGEPIDVDVPVNPMWTSTGPGAGLPYDPPQPPPPDPIDVDVPVTPVWQWAAPAVGDGTGGPDPYGDFNPTGFEVTIPVSADTSNAQAQVDELAVYAEGQEGTIAIAADGTSAEQTIGSVTDAAGSMPDGTVTLLGDGSGALGTIDDVNSAGASMPDQSIAIGGDASGYYAAIPTTGITIGTNYIDIVTRNFGSPFAHGGIIDAAAHGRVLGGMSLVGEFGPELLLGGEGRGGMVVPATSTAQSRSAGSVHIENLTVQATGDWKEIAYQVTQQLVPAIQRATAEHNRRSA